MSTPLKRILGGVLAVALLILAVIWCVQVQATVGSVSADPAGDSLSTLGGEPALEDPLNAVPQETNPIREVAVTSAPPEEAGRLEEAVDRSARDSLRIHVTNLAGVDIAQATIKVTAFRSVTAPVTWHAWHEGSLREKTNRDGIAELNYPVWALGSGGDWLPLSKLCFTVEHPQYFTQQIDGVVESDEVHVVLEHGSTLIVSAWIDSPAERILELTPLLSDGEDVGHPSWVRLRDGRLACDRIPPGKYVIVLRHDLDGSPYSSAGVEFDLGENDQKELHLQLIPPRTVQGTLDAQVPRPVEHGHVQVAVENGARKRGAVLMQRFSTITASDGSFELKDLPPGEIEIISLCDGWTSVSSPDHDSGFVRRTQIVPEDYKGEFVVRMEPAALLEVTVLDPAGRPLEGASVQMTPNVHWRTGYSGPFACPPDAEEVVRRRWRARTNESGVALMANLPPKDLEHVVVSYSGFRMPMGTTPWGTAARSAWVDLRSGAVAELTVRLEERED